jgi:hypothetical protein
MTLGVNGLKVASSVRNVWQITAPGETKPEDLLAPGYWAHVARQLRMGDRIEVLAADASWYAELRVMEVGRKEAFGARVAFTLPPVRLQNENALPALNDFEAKPFGAMWHVYKIGQPDPVKSDLPDQKSAEKWINSQRRALAA